MDAFIDRRRFLQRALKLSAATVAAQHSFAQIAPSLRHWAAGRPVSELVRDESYWVPVQRSFTLPERFINLEHGYFSMMPQQTLEAFISNVRDVNTDASYFMRRRNRDMLEKVREELADFAGCGRDEVAITRNTTESMNIIIQGLDLAAGDEIVLGDQDYGSMVEALRYREQRHGIVLKRVEVPTNPQSDQEVVDAYTSAFTPKTKLLHLTHLINITGHVLPVRKVADAAHAAGIEVLCDAAHSFAHIDFKIDDLGVDYLGTSLHKWLCTPLGLGLLYVKKEKVEKIWPLIARIRDPRDIRKLDALGTQPFSAQQTIPDAIAFQHAIGSELKQERLRYLRQHWQELVIDHPNIVYHSPKQHARTSAIGNVGIRGMAPASLGQKLWDDYRIFVAPIGHTRVPGVRVTPHLCTRLEEIDTFAAAMRQLADKA